MNHLSIISYLIILFFSGVETKKISGVQKIIDINENHEKFISKNLFSEESVLNISIKCDFKEILNDRSEKSNYHDALMEFENEFYSIKLKTRGIFRRKKDNCAIPPLWVKFKTNEMVGSVFSGYKKIKLVTPCHNIGAYEQNILKEYLTYKIYNLLTDYSFRVRLVKMSIIDLDNDQKPINRYVFFIEPVDDLCNRVNGNNLEVKNIHPNFIDKKLVALMSVFQYLVGNTDWSIKALHNIKLISRDSLQKPVAIPYDFDYAGLVNAPYAVPASHLGIQSVRQRIYNGYYKPMDELQKTLDLFRSKKIEIYKLVYSIKGMQKKYIDETIKYFDQFYKTLDHPKRIQHELIDKSRKD
ncbi:MAG: hypothetical protein ABFS35_16715 [Bacteroidota bacterium]